MGSIYSFNTTVKIFADRQANAGRNRSSAKISSREISFFFVSLQIEVSSCVQTNAQCAVDRLCISIALLFCKWMSNVAALLNPELSPPWGNKQAVQGLHC